MEDLGGLQEGILLPRVYKADDSYPRVQLSEEANIMLPPASAEPKKFGTVVSDWFFTYYSGTFGVHRQFYVENFKPLKEYLNDLAPFLVSNDRDKFRQALNAQSRLRKEMKTFAAIQKDLLTEIERKSNMEAGPSSSSENSQFDAPFRKRAVEINTAHRHAKHVIHKMVNTIKALYNDDFSKTMQSYIIEMYLNKPQLRAENWQNILEKFNDYIASPERPKEASSELETDFKFTMTEMCDNEQKNTLRLVDVKIVEEKDEQLAEKDKQLEEQKRRSEKQLAEQNREIEQKNQRIAELEKKLAQRQKNSSDSEQSLPSSESHSSTPAPYSEKSAPLSSNSRITFLAEIEMADEPKEKKEKSESKSAFF